MQEKPAFTPRPHDIATALALLTRLPVNASFARSAQAPWAYPLAGLAVALIAGAVATICGWLGLGAGLTAAFAITTPIIVTGAMHEDGLADCADGFWGGWDKARRLEIMRDSQIGTYGVLAIGLALLFRFTTLSSLAHAGTIVSAMIAAAMLSRAGMATVMALLPLARTDGLSHRTGRPTRITAVAGAVCALALSGLVIGFVPTVLAASAVTLTSFIAARIALAKIGGQTGDVLGATQILSEIAVLSTLVGFA